MKCRLLQGELLMVVIILAFQRLDTRALILWRSLTLTRHPTESAIAVISTAVISSPSKSRAFRPRM
jgi:hypothetical protein